MIFLRCLSLSILLPFGAARAQDQATTLLAALRGADAVVCARVTAATDPSPDWHRMQFDTTAVLKGPAPASFAVMEPAGACCGRSLFALQAGDVRLLFLQRRGPQWHPFGGARGVVPADAAVVAHVQALQAAGDAAALAHLLAASLDAPEARIADDAAHALATLPHLSLSATDRTAVALALQQALQLRTTRLPALADVAARVADDAMVDVLLTSYLDAPRDDQANLLRSSLQRCSSPAVTARLPQFVDSENRGVRAAQLLVALPTAEARSVLAGVLHGTTHPRVQLCVAEGLLASGVRGIELAASVPPPVLELAQRRSNQPRRFRAIDPSRR